jgi:serine protease Do
MQFKRVALAFVAALAVATGTARAEFPNPLGLFRRGSKQPTPVQLMPHAPAGTGVPHSFADIVRSARRTVVNISTTQTVRNQGVPQLGPRGQFGEENPFSEFSRPFFGAMPHSFTQRSLGSGVIISADGYIVTNAHIVTDADKVAVKLEDNREFEAKVVGIDEKTDVALVKIAAPGDLAAATLGNSDTLQVGDWVLAIGNPFGLSETVTAGIVSAKARVIGEGPYDDFIQTDASINPGNSGGPLLDMRGEVAGINAAILSQSGGNIGIGFAIPINLVKNVVDQLEAQGKVVRGWLGAAVQELTPELAESFGFTQMKGGLVVEVTPDSPAARAGIERGDLILEYNGTHVDAAHQLPALVAGTPIGATVPLVVLRNGKKVAVSATVAEMPAAATGAAAAPLAGDWGMTVSDVTPDLAAQLNLKRSRGVVVTAVAPDSTAADAGIEPGDVIVEVNRRSLHDLSEYRVAVAAAGNAQSLLLLVDRGGQSVFVALHRGG